MPAHGVYVMDEQGLNRYLNGERSLRRFLRQRAELGAKVAKALAPVGTDSPSPGEFRDSIHVAPADNHVRTKHGLVPGVRIVADSRDAVWAEFGRKRRNPYRGARAMGRMASFLNTPKRHRRI